MIKVANVLKSFDELYEKQAFVPSPFYQQMQGIYAQITQFAQQLPPEVQQQIQARLQQIQQLPPEVQMQALEQVGAQLQEVGQQQQQVQQQQVQQQTAAQGLDAQITISVRELVDLISGGKATGSQLKVDALKQKAEQQAQQQQVEQQAAQNSGVNPQAAGVYPVAPVQ